MDGPSCAGHFRGNHGEKHTAPVLKDLFTYWESRVFVAKMRKLRLTGQVTYLGTAN